MIKIYFSGSVRAGRNNARIYSKLIDYIGQFGLVLTVHVGNVSEESPAEELDDCARHNRNMKWLSEADAVIAEVSTPSLGVGYEIGRAIEAGKPVLCLFNNHADFELSAMISGCGDIDVYSYNDLSDAYIEIDRFLKGITGQ